MIFFCRLPYSWGLRSHLLCLVEQLSFGTVRQLEVQAVKIIVIIIIIVIIMDIMAIMVIVPKRQDSSESPGTHTIPKWDLVL